MRLRFLALALPALATLGCSGGQSKPAPSGSLPPPIDAVTPLPSPLPDVAARVNGQPVRLARVELLAKKLLEPSGNAPKDRPFAYRRATQQLIVRELLLEEALARHYSADDAKVEQLYNEARVGYRDDDAWAAFLASQGLDPQTFRTEIRTQQTIAALLTKEGERIRTQVTDGEAKAFYEQNPAFFDSGERLLASHILLRLSPEATPQQKQAVRGKAEGLIRRLGKGEDFAALARQLSEDVGSAGKGGLLEEFHRGQMVPAFEQAAQALKPGELSGVVETPFGLHIIKLHERKAAIKLPFTSVVGQIHKLVLKQRRDQQIQDLIARVWAKASIETYL